MDALELLKIAEEERKKAVGDTTASAPIGNLGIDTGSLIAKADTARQNAGGGNSMGDISLDSLGKPSTNRLIAEAEVARSNASGEPLSGLSGVQEAIAKAEQERQASRVKDKKDLAPPSLEGVSPTTAEEVASQVGGKDTLLPSQPDHLDDSSRSQVDAHLSKYLSQHVGEGKLFASLSLDKVKKGELQVALHSDKSGQTIYKLSAKEAKKRGLGESAVYFNVPGDAPKASVEMSPLQQALQAKSYLSGKPTAEALLQEHQRVVDLGMQIHQHAEQAALDTPLVHQIQAKVDELAQQIGNSPKPDSKLLQQELAWQKQLTELKKQASRVAKDATLSNPQYQSIVANYNDKLQLFKAQSKEHGGKVAPQQPIIDVLTKTVHMKAEDATAFAHASKGTPVAQDTKRFVSEVIMNNGELPKLTTPGGQVYMHLNIKAHVGEAIKANPAQAEQYQMEGQAVEKAYATAMDIADTLKAGDLSAVKPKLAALGLDKSIAPDTKTIYQQALKASVLKTSLYYAVPEKYRAVLQNPDTAAETLKSMGLDKEQGRALLETAFNQAELSPIAKSAGLSEMLFRAQAHAQLNRIYPPSVWDGVHKMFGGN